MDQPQVSDAPPVGSCCAGSHESLAHLDRTMQRIKRSQTRRTQTRLAMGSGDCVDHGLIAVVDAVGEGPPSPDGEVTVGLVADRLGIDPSRASRMVTNAIDSGHVVRVASQRDGRRIGLELTSAGRQALQQAQRFRQGLLARAMRDWTEHERAEFVRLFSRFTDSFLDATGC